MMLQIIKFKNGDDIVCEVIGDGDGFLKIANPMQMLIQPRVTEEGYGESIALTRWMQPYTEDNTMRIRKDSIITVVNASSGMKSFYKRMLGEKEKSNEDVWREEKDFDDDEARRVLDNISPSRRKMYH